MDVAISVYLIDYARCAQVENIALFAGDRDFIDAINYAKHILKKKITIMAYDTNLANRIRYGGIDFVTVTNHLYMLI